MAESTLDDLALRVLTRLGEVGFGQQVEPEARTRVVAALPGLLGELGITGVYDFAASLTVPAPALDPLAVLMASRLARDFGVPDDTITVLAAEAQGAKERLLRMNFQTYSGWRPRRSTYF